ncbi:MAG: hypothetical protein CMA92_00150 [Euryarchaeota archaeon]|nr:hypothetical protein [Euryarchaeota archaeon]
MPMKIDQAILDEIESCIKGSKIERIELIDLLAPPKRSADDIADLFKLKIRGNTTMKELDKQKKEILANDNSTFMNAFGISKTGLVDMIEKYSFDKSIFNRIPKRSLSFSLKSGLSGFWAPNGYGKTYAIKNILSKLKDSSGSSTFRSFENFIISTHSELIIESNQDGLFRDIRTNRGRPLKSKSEITSSLIPFRQINYITDTNVIVSISLNHLQGMYNDFSIKISKVDNNFEDCFVYEDVKFPIWLHDKGQKIFFSNNVSENDRIDNEVIKPILDQLLNLSFEYVEIPKMSYSDDIFRKISDDFIEFIGPKLAVGYSMNSTRQLTLLSRLDVESSGILDKYGINRHINRFIQRSKNFSSDDSSATITKELYGKMQQLNNVYNAYKHGGDTSLQDKYIEKSMNELMDDFDKIDPTMLSEKLDNYRKVDFDILSDKDFRKMKEDLARESASLELIQTMKRINKSKNRQFGKRREVYDFISSIEERFNSVIKGTGSPWDIEVKLIDWRAEKNRNIFMFRYRGSNESNQHRASWDTLSFGQKSNFILHSALILEEFLNDEEAEWPVQRCTVVDEPEAGKAESWISELINNLNESHNRLHKRKRSSVMILSHRGIILDSISEDGTYSLLHHPELDEEE